MDAASYGPETDTVCCDACGCELTGGDVDSSAECDGECICHDGRPCEWCSSDDTDGDGYPLQCLSCGSITPGVHAGNCAAAIVF